MTAKKKLKCVQCGKALKPKAYRYCSKDCRVAYSKLRRRRGFAKTTGVEKTCDSCGKTYTPKDRAQRRFCSDSCRLEFWRRERRVDLGRSICVYCGVEYKRKSKNSVFCGSKCQATAKKDEEYFNGMRRTAIGFDKRECWICQKSNLKVINVHHIIKRNEYDDPLLVVLCRGCHSLVTRLGNRTFLDDSHKVADMLTLARFSRLLPNAKTIVRYEEI